VGDRYTWADAVAVHIAGLNEANFGGHNDWRLPNIKELIGIMNFGNVDPAVSPAFVPVSVSVYYWSSTSVSDRPVFAHQVYFGRGGFISIDLKFITAAVRAVRGGL
jgi:hypothetical protein